MKNIDELFDELKNHPEFIGAQIYTVRGVISDFYDAYCDMDEDDCIVIQSETLLIQMIEEFIHKNKNRIRDILLSNDDEWYEQYIDMSLKEIIQS